MSSRLFKHQMAASNVRQPAPHLVISNGDTFSVGAGFPFVGKSSFTDAQLVRYNDAEKMLFIILRTAGARYQLFKITAGAYIPITLPVTISAMITGASFSKDGQYLAFTIDTAPYVYLFKKNADDSFTRVTLPTITSYSSIIALNDDGSIMARGLGVAPFLEIYLKQAGNSFIKSFYTIPSPPTGLFQGIEFVTKNILVVAQNNAKPVLTYNVPATTGQPALKTDAGFNTTYSLGTRMSPDRSILAIRGVFGTAVYRHDGTGKFVSIAIPQPLASLTDIAFSKDMRYMAVSSLGAPYLEMYQIVSDAFTKITGPAAAAALHTVEFVYV